MAQFLKTCQFIYFYFFGFIFYMYKNNRLWKDHEREYKKEIALFLIYS